MFWWCDETTVRSPQFIVMWWAFRWLSSDWPWVSAIVTNAAVFFSVVVLCVARSEHCDSGRASSRCTDDGLIDRHLSPMDFKLLVIGSLVVFFHTSRNVERVQQKRLFVCNSHHNRSTAQCSCLAHSGYFVVLHLLRPQSAERDATRWVESSKIRKRPKNWKMKITAIWETNIWIGIHIFSAVVELSRTLFHALNHGAVIKTERTKH